MLAGPSYLIHPINLTPHFLLVKFWTQFNQRPAKFFLKLHLIKCPQGTYILLEEPAKLTNNHVI